MQNAAANASPAPVGSTTSAAGEAMRRPHTMHPAAPSLTAVTGARPSIATGIASASAAVANKMSGLIRASSDIIRAGP